MDDPKVPGTENSNSDCIRCGTCCEKGGPGFHQEDRALIDTGVIPSRCLFTIRRGELAYDNVRGCLMPVDSDVIKIKGKTDTWTCMFFDEPGKQCKIYDDRPGECRALKCWDTRELEKVYAGRRLTREDLLSKVEGLWDLIQDHQRRCNYEKIIKLIDDLNGSAGKRARKELLETIQFDAEIRKLVVEQGGMDPEMLDFLFGRPLSKTLPNYGIKIQQDGRKTIITRSSRQSFQKAKSDTPTQHTK
jgi:Fe-S-cluster containining protein